MSSLDLSYYLQSYTASKRSRGRLENILGEIASYTDSVETMIGRLTTLKEIITHDYKRNPYQLPKTKIIQIECNILTIINILLELGNISTEVKLDKNEIKKLTDYIINSFKEEIFPHLYEDETIDKKTIN